MGTALRILNSLAIAATLVLTAVAITVLSLRGYDAWFAVVGGILLGLVPIVLLFGFLSALAPALVIRWREAAMVRNAGHQKRVGEFLSKMVAIEGQRPWESPRAQRRVRLLGISEVAVWVLVGTAVQVFGRS